MNEHLHMIDLALASIVQQIRSDRATRPQHGYQGPFLLYIDEDG